MKLTTKISAKSFATDTMDETADDIMLGMIVGKLKRVARNTDYPAYYGEFHGFHVDGSEPLASGILTHHSDFDDLVWQSGSMIGFQIWRVTNPETNRRKYQFRVITSREQML